MKFFSLIISLQFACILYAQNGWEPASLEEFSQAILDAESNIQEGSSYSYETTYSVYKTFTGSKAAVTSPGFLICKKGKELNLSQMGRFIVQNAVYNIACDSSERTIVVTDAVPELLSRKTAMDMSVVNTSQCTVQKKQNGNTMKYYLEFPEGKQFLAAEVWLKADGFVERYILYSPNEVVDEDSEENASIQPRLEITCTNFRLGDQVNTDAMKTVDDFILIEKGEIQLREKYKEFELIDLRDNN